MGLTFKILTKTALIVFSPPTTDNGGSGVGWGEAENTSSSGTNYFADFSVTFNFLLPASPRIPIQKQAFKTSFLIR